MRTVFAVLVLCLSNSAIAQETTMKIRLIIDGKVISGTLVDNATTRDLVSLLPMTVTLEDYAATEKITYSHASSPRRARLPAATLTSAALLTTRLGEISRSSTKTRRMRAD